MVILGDTPPCHNNAIAGVAFNLMMLMDSSRSAVVVMAAVEDKAREGEQKRVAQGAIMVAIKKANSFPNDVLIYE